MECPWGSDELSGSGKLKEAELSEADCINLCNKSDAYVKTKLGKFPKSSLQFCVHFLYYTMKEHTITFLDEVLCVAVGNCPCFSRLPGNVRDTAAVCALPWLPEGELLKYKMKHILMQEEGY